MKKLLCTYCVVLTVFAGKAQSSVSQKISKIERAMYAATTDTIRGIVLQDFLVVAENSEYLTNLNKTRYFVARVYPYALQAADLINMYNEELAKLTKESDRRKFIKKANKELKEEFGDEIKDMSITRGQYLVKLIHRETGKTAYSIIKDYKNGFSASSWQTISLIGGANLKLEYDPEGKDWLLEKVIQEVESGTLKLVERPAKTEPAKTATKKRLIRKKAKSK
jgi:hypothetical protein